MCTPISLWPDHAPRLQMMAKNGTEGGATSREDGRLWSRAHTAEWQGSVAMQRLFAQANASGHSRGDRVAGLAVAARREEVGKEEAQKLCMWV